jgi:hypothetical protein
MQGALDAADALYQEVLALAGELGDDESAAFAMLNLAMVAIGRGETARAPAILLDAAARAERVGSRVAGHSVIEVAAGLSAARGDFERAATLYGVAEAQAARTGLQRDAPDEAFLAPHMARTREALSGSAFAACEERGRDTTYDAASSQTRAWLEGLARRAGQGA